MADGRHIENRFWLYLGTILADLCKFRNGDEESHAEYRSLDQNGNFRKFKMADGRHFENSFISVISVGNYPISIKFGTPMQMSDIRHIESRFLAISRRLIGQLT